MSMSIYSHLMQKGISLDYIRWTEHGETSTSHSEDYVDDGEDDTLIDESDDMSDDDLDDMLDNIGQSTWGDGWKTSGKSEFIMQIFSQRRGQWKAASQSQEFFRTLQRYYSNAYMDAQKQDAINVFLGHYQPQVGKPALWELDSDQHQNVGSRGSNFLEKNTRGSYQRSLSDGNFTSSAIDIGQNEESEHRYPGESQANNNVLSESSPEISTCESYSSFSRYAHSMPRRQLFVDTHSDDYPNSDRIFYNKRLDSFNYYKYTSDLQLLEDLTDRVLKEHSVFVVTSKRSSLDKCKLPVGIRLFVSAAHTESDLQKAYESLKIVAASVLTEPMLQVESRSCLGNFFRWSKSSDWQPGLMGADLEWKEIAEPVMELYREATDGSTIETKDSGLVWHHQDADLVLVKLRSCWWSKSSDWQPGLMGADLEWKEIAEPVMELYREATDGSTIETKDSGLNVLANEPALVKRGRHIVEVKPQVSSLFCHFEKAFSGQTHYFWPIVFRSEEIAAAYVSMDTKFQSDASDLKSCVNDSLMLDQEMKKEFDSMSKICVDHLTCLGDKHGDSTKSMLNQAEGLKKDYQ
ncbi:phosphoinositide phosphatase SAC2-like protein isoform X2, partial [Tanacetum coccineum]